MQKLLQAATEPYFSMLQLWLHQGVLNDPYAEFMVQEDKVRHACNCPHQQLACPIVADKD